MKKIGWIFLLLVGYMILSNKNILQEGFENDDNCEYRKKRTGTMCNEKWGEPKCNKWNNNEKISMIEGKHTNVLKGYYSNQYMYEIDYEEYDSGIQKDDTESDDSNDDKEIVPRGVHSSFFS